MTTPGQAGRDAAPLDSRAVLRWMSENGAVLRALVAEESGRGDAGEEGLAADAHVRAHLRFAAAAIAATAAPGLAESLDGLAEELPVRFAEGRPLLDEHLSRGAGAIALEEHLQHGARPGSDPSLDAGLERRVRIGGWIRLFLLAVEDRLGPSADGIGDAVLAGMDARHRRLARLVLTLDRHAKLTARRARGGAPDLDTLDGIGQAAVVQAHVRLLIEELAAGLEAAG